MSEIIRMSKIEFQKILDEMQSLKKEKKNKKCSFFELFDLVAEKNDYSEEKVMTFCEAYFKYSPETFGGLNAKYWSYSGSYFHTFYVLSKTSDWEKEATIYTAVFSVQQGLELLVKGIKFYMFNTSLGCIDKFDRTKTFREMDLNSHDIEGLFEDPDVIEFFEKGIENGANILKTIKQKYSLFKKEILRGQNLYEICRYPNGVDNYLGDYFPAVNKPFIDGFYEYFLDIYYFAIQILGEIVTDGTQRSAKLEKLSIERIIRLAKYKQSKSMD